MTKATWNGKVLAESNNTKLIEGNVYFPPDSVNMEYFKESSNETHTTCPWKGKADYCDIVVKEEVNKDAAWHYPEPKPAAEEIKNYVAFWKGVEVK